MVPKGIVRANILGSRYTRVTMKRPTGITVTAALMAFAILAGVVHGLFTPLPALHTVASVRPVFFLLARVLPYTFAVFECACIWAYWAGVEWARILVLIDCVLQFIALHRLTGLWHRFPTMAVLEIGKALVAVFLLWYLFQPRVRAWFAGSAKETGRDDRGTPAQHSQPTV